MRRRMTAERVVGHHCHAVGCANPCKPEFLMCPTHWGTVPLDLQKQVYATYRPGQCDDMDPSAAWHVAADAAIGAVALFEGRSISTNQLKAVLKLGKKSANWRLIQALGELKKRGSRQLQE